jgi:branched-chain amino acid transport system permease protein
VPNLADQISKAAPGAVRGIILILFLYLAPAGIAGVFRMVIQRLNKARK